MDQILNFHKDDPFGTRSSKEKIHIRIQMRTTRKSITIIEGLHLHLNAEDMKAFIKKIKKTYGCNGNVVKDEDVEVVQFQGDQRENISILLQKKYQVREEDIITHGF